LEAKFRSLQGDGLTALALALGTATAKRREHSANAFVAAHRVADGVHPLPVGKRMSGCKRVLDLGCGSGRDLASWGVSASDKVTGLDIDNRRLALAKARFSNRTYLQCVGECLPFENESFDRVISAVALPYMNIQKALAEIHRILVPGGGLSLSLHLPIFTLNELVHRAMPKPIPTLFRLYVMTNGAWFHCTGRTVGFLRGRTESFQTERGMRLALKHAGFANPSFSRDEGPAGVIFVVEASKLEAVNPLTLRASA
jgi:ubiquinone/menaquinone biosynthesis C-methylase UbiE